MKSILHPYKMRTTYMIKCTNSCCGWLASSFLHCLHQSTICENTTWNSMTCHLLGVACSSWSILLIASTKHLKYPSDHHFHVSLPSTTLGLSTHRRQASTLGRSDLSPRTILDTHLKRFDWLIQVMDLILISILSTKSVQTTLLNQMALYSFHVMLKDHLKTKLRYLKYS